MKKNEVAELFEKRTGVKYQNWIQALSVTHNMNNKKLLPKWLALIILLLVMIICGTCYSPPNDAIAQQERFIRNHPLWKEQADEILNKDTRQLEKYDKISLLLSSIIDLRKELHEYNIPITIQSHETTTQYCKRHFKWEVITAYWNPQKNYYDYLVAKHRKER